MENSDDNRELLRLMEKKKKEIAGLLSSKTEDITLSLYAGARTNEKGEDENKLVLAVHACIELGVLD